MKLATRLYEQFMTDEAMAPWAHASRRVSDVSAFDIDARPDLLARHRYDVVRRALSTLICEERIVAQLALANRVLDQLANAHPDHVLAGDAVTRQVLLSLLDREQVFLGQGRLERADISLGTSELIVNGPRDLREEVEIARELPPADPVDLMRFVKWARWVELKNGLLAYRPRPLRLLATTYPGDTDVEALKAFRELHHAAAETYDALLKHLRAQLLLGLNASPERIHGRSILHWYDGRVPAESGPWDALDQDLLLPFACFVRQNGTNLSQVNFRGGRYSVASLERLYTADEHPAKQVLLALVETVLNPAQMRALGFCVSVAHAEYMPAFFVRHHLPAEALYGKTARDQREALVRGELRCLCTVDPLDEGIDISLVDTVLVLRPTERATIFLQQLERGRRTNPDKAGATVLDFAGTAHHYCRFKAQLGGGARQEVQEAVERGFTRLPLGCSIHLERQAVVLQNLKGTLSRWSALADDVEPGITLAAYLARTQLTPEDVYRPNRRFSELRAIRRFVNGGPHRPVARSLRRLLHVNDAVRLTAGRPSVGAHTEVAAVRRTHSRYKIRRRVYV